MKITFAENLKMLRENSKLTQQQLADALHTTQRKVSYWESGKIEPDLCGNKFPPFSAKQIICGKKISIRYKSIKQKPFLFCLTNLK